MAQRRFHGAEFFKISTKLSQCFLSVLSNRNCCFQNHITICLVGNEYIGKYNKLWRKSHAHTSQIINGSFSVSHIIINNLVISRL